MKCNLVIWGLLILGLTVAWGEPTTTPETNVTEPIHTWVVNSTHTIGDNASWSSSTIHKRLNHTQNSVHIVGFEVKLADGPTANFTRKLVALKCRPNHELHRLLQETFVTEYGQSAPLMALKTNQTLVDEYCEVFFFWAKGSNKKITFPKDVSYPLGGEKENSDYIILQVDLDLMDLSNSSFPMNLKIEFQVNYIEQPRKHEAAFLHLDRLHYLTVPNATKESPSKMTIPERIMKSSSCSPFCTPEFPDTGLNILGVIFHSNVSGVEFNLQHFKGNQELPCMANGGSQNATLSPFKFQSEKNPRADRKLSKGENLVLTCAADNDRFRNATKDKTYVKELCEGFILYYPKIESSEEFCVNESALPSRIPFHKLQTALMKSNKIYDYLCRVVDANKTQGLFGELPDKADRDKNYKPCCNGGNGFQYVFTVLVACYLFQFLI